MRRGATKASPPRPRRGPSGPSRAPESTCATQPFGLAVGHSRWPFRVRAYRDFPAKASAREEGIDTCSSHDLLGAMRCESNRRHDRRRSEDTHRAAPFPLASPRGMHREGCARKLHAVAAIAAQPLRADLGLLMRPRTLRGTRSPRHRRVAHALGLGEALGRRGKAPPSAAMTPHSAASLPRELMYSVPPLLLAPVSNYPRDLQDVVQCCSVMQHDVCF